MRASDSACISAAWGESASSASPKPFHLRPELGSAPLPSLHSTQVQPLARWQASLTTLNDTLSEI